MAEDTRPLTATVSLGRKISDSDFGSFDHFLSIHSITAETTDEEMEAVLETTRVAFSREVAHMRELIKEARKAL